jgi:ABC-type sugar transport system substrate-binding protein
VSGRSVVVFLPDRTNAFQVLQAEDACQAAEKLALAIEIREAGGNAVAQIQQLFKSVHAAEPPRALVVEPVSLEAMERVAQKAAAAGIGFAILNCAAPWLPALRAQHPGLAVFALGSDQAEIGRLQGRQMLRLLPGGGTALYVQGPQTADAARERARGTREALAGSRIDLVTLDALWTEESAEQAVRSWLRLRSAAEVHLVAGQDDSIARGARRAFETSTDLARRSSDVPFLGIDGVPSEGQRLVREGTLTATVVMPSNTGPALEAIDAWLRSGTPPKAALRVPVRSFPPEEQLAPRR